MNEIISTQLSMRHAIILFSVIGGVVTIYLGYRLFIMGVTGQFKFHSTFKGFRADLVSASPGVFFAFLGTVIIMVSLTRGFTIVEKPTPLVLLIKPQLESAEAESSEVPMFYGRSYPVTLPQGETTYYLTATAYNEDSSESVYSEDLIYDLTYDKDGGESVDSESIDIIKEVPPPKGQ